MMRKSWKAELGHVMDVFVQPESVAFAVLVSLATWASVLAPRVLGIVMPVAAVCAFIGATKFRQRMRMPAMDTEVWQVWAVVVGLIGLSAFWSPDIGYGLERTAKIASSLAMGIFLFFLAGELMEPARQRLRHLLMLSFAFALFLVAIYMLTAAEIVQTLLGHGSLDDAALGANRAAVVLAVLMWPTLLAAQEAGRRRYTYALPVVTFAALLLTYSQTGPLVVLAGGIVYLFCRMLPRPSVLLVGITGAVLILAMPFLFQLTCADLMSGDIDWRAASTGARIEIWCAVSNAVPADFFFGHGVEAARFVPDWHMAHRYFLEASVLHPHNAVLQIWYEYGVTGALIAAAIWIAVVRRISHLGPQARAICFASLTSIAVVSCVSHGLWQSWWLGTVGIVPALFRMVSGRIWFSARDE